MTQTVFVTGGTGYIGRRLIEILLARGHHVRALARGGSVHRLPAGCEPVVGDALEAASYADAIVPADVLVHLIGVSHPNPAKADQFRSIDLRAARAAVDAAKRAGVRHFVYLSVAQPAPVMREYIAARAEAEAYLAQSGLAATVLRPWYVLGPGHRWPYLLLPFYWLAECLPGTRETARRLGLVTLAQMVDALRAAVERPAQGMRIVEVPEIRAA
jgi:uncharacterized protein YbjT (DUF2867 family)